MIENRRALRFECEESLVCKYGETEFQASVMDVSRGGMRISTNKRLRVGSKVVLRLENKARGRAPVEAVVRWTELGDVRQVGLEFEDSASKLSKRWVRKLFPEEGATWTAGKQQRSEIRAKTRLPVISSDGVVEGTTLDLSRSGAQLELSGELDKDAGLLLFLPGSYLEVKADILRVEEKSGKWVHSVQLADLTDSQEQKLDSFVEDRTNAAAFEQHSGLWPRLSCSVRS